MIKGTLLSLFLVANTFFCVTANAEFATYENVELYGLARNGSWNYVVPYDAKGMVCNVNGPDGFLSLRSGPGTGYTELRRFNRLAIMEVDTSDRQGRWIKVYNVYRTHTVDGFQYDETIEFSLTGSGIVEGWVHDGYLCDFGS